MQATVYRVPCAAAAAAPREHKKSTVEHFVLRSMPRAICTLCPRRRPRSYGGLWLPLLVLLVLPLILLSAAQPERGGGGGGAGVIFSEEEQQGASPPPPLQNSGPPPHGTLVGWQGHGGGRRTLWQPVEHEVGLPGRWGGPPIKRGRRVLAAIAAASEASRASMAAAAAAAGAAAAAAVEPGAETVAIATASAAVSAMSQSHRRVPMM
jgi:hypothetical protein